MAVLCTVVCEVTIRFAWNKYTNKLVTERNNIIIVIIVVEALIISHVVCILSTGY
jgi:hypothetical protein